MEIGHQLDMMQIWTKIPESFKVDKGWIMMESPDSYCTTSPGKHECVYGNEKAKHQNTRVIRELKITKYLNFSLSVSGKQVPPSCSTCTKWL